VDVQDKVDIITHFLHDYELQAGGWVRVEAGKYEVVQVDALLDNIAGYTSASVSSCSLEISLKLAPLQHAGRCVQPLQACLQQTAAQGCGAPQLDAERWERLAPLSLLCLDVAPPSGTKQRQDDDVHTPDDDTLTFISATLMRHGQVPPPCACGCAFQVDEGS